METAQSYEIEPQKGQTQPINIDFSQKGIVPNNYNELLQMAALVHRSGLAPKSLDTVQKVAIAMAMCMEVGRPVLTGIQDMAVINGKVGMFGDAVLAVIRSSGLLEKFNQWEEGVPYGDDWVVHTLVKRKGAEEKTDYFSWQDAKRAGVADPKTRDGRPDQFSPWRRWPRRMMYFKSRNFLLRDEFGDLLKGIQPAEDFYDQSNTVDLNPGANGSWSTPEAEAPATSLKERLDAAREEKAQGQAKPEEPKPKEPVNEPPMQAPTPEPEPQREQADPTETMRQEWINIRKPESLATYVYKNKGRIMAEFPEGLKAELRAKWNRIVTDGAPFPLDPPAETAAAQNDNGKPAIHCPRKDSRIFVEVCEASNCGGWANCKPYREWKAAQTVEEQAANEMVACPERDGDDVPAADCAECEMREGCPAWD